MKIPGFSSLEEIESRFGVTFENKGKLKKIIEKHPMFISSYYAELIDWNNPDDPLKKIVFPSVDELNVSGSYDTSGEKENTVITGLQHKYRETALLLVTNRCAGYCRHCFRKRMVGIPTEETVKIFDMAVDYIKEHGEITNVLISGGDPLTLPTEVIDYFLKELKKVPHLKFVRIGTRIPVFYPERIYDDSKLLSIFDKFSKEKALYVVTHFNHEREVTEEAAQAVRVLTRSGVVVSNQTVLLKGVNDDPEILSSLMKSLVSINVLPYYVFQCRPVKRVKSHFQVPLKAGYEIIEKAKQKLDGFGKRFKYIMSHKTGKIEIVGIIGKEIYLKYHQAKDYRKVGKLFKRILTPSAGWLDDLKRPEKEREFVL
ncbi:MULTISPECIES: KamA family radical SAM protein [unclassified Desulfurobacterium]|uniref:KamA family radical SAM protein n=1 Tax=Desulfurobacterium sp. TC5-1 TaxID=1158318 RepID=UPI0003B77236|nr:KamA family radical SAM protein [Desulfurobacterium sp. TC5-1]